MKNLFKNTYIFHIDMFTNSTIVKFHNTHISVYGRLHKGRRLVKAIHIPNRIFKNIKYTINIKFSSDNNKLLSPRSKNTSSLFKIHGENKIASHHETYLSYLIDVKYFFKFYLTSITFFFLVMPLVTKLLTLQNHLKQILFIRFSEKSATIFHL